MRVPTYQSQGKRTTEVSARQLNVRANPGALAAESQALANFGQTAAKVGQTWYEKSLKAERAGQLTEAENQLAESLRNTEIKLLNTNPADVPTLYEQETTAAIATISSGIKDPVVQRRFKSSAASTTLTKSVTVFKDARLRGIDQKMASFDTAIENKINTIATGGRADAHKARVELFGGIASDGSQVAGIFEDMADAGYIKATDIASRRQTAEQRIDFLGAQSILNGVAVRRSAEDAESFLITLQDPNQFPNMKPEKREQLINRANTLATMLRRAATAEAAKADAAAAKELKNTQDKNFARVMTQIKRFRQGDGNELPDILDIITMQADRTLTDTQANVLEKALLGEDAPATNTITMASFFGRLDQAQDQDDIDAILNDARSHLGPKGDIKIEDFLKINSYANALEEKTPRAKEIKRVGSLLRRAIGDSDANFGTQFDPQFMGQLRADALDTYHELVHDTGREDPLEPKEAFKMVMRMFNDAKTQELTFLAPSSIVMDLISDINPSAAKKLSDFSTWSENDLESAAALVAASPDLTPLQKAIEAETLLLIGHAVRERLKGLDTSVDTNEEIGAGGATEDDANKGILEKLLEGIGIGGGEQTLNEKRKALEERGGG
tara:strand:+ start:202 stop:2046 length:1845 start_codon:yes stop_codon:yes gene_type:complete